MTDSTNIAITHTSSTLLQSIMFYINLLASISTTVASTIAIYIFFKNRKKISTALNTLLNYSNQLTLNDLKNKIERLNDYNAEDAVQKKEVINILHEIEGQINGNRFLLENLEEQLNKINGYNSNTGSITEPKKRSIVSELRESIRGLDITNFKNVTTNTKK